MKKRFTLMMMVLCFLMSIPLKMMAQKVTIHYIDEEKWSDIYAYVYQKGGSDIGPKWHGTPCTDIKVVGDKRVATWTLDLKGIRSTTATTDYEGENLLKPLITARVVPTMEHTTYNNVEDDYYNYLFGFYRAQKVSDDKNYKENDFLLGFWISNGKGTFYSNSAYLPVAKADAEKMNLGVSYDDFDPTTKVKKVPALFFDFANVGGTTGINEVVNQSTKLNDGKYYTLSGQQVEKPTAGGIYIHNGRKFVVK